ncbi:MAG: hybrid sensor histidine kinase/response regulator [Acidobacteria bacterium]|nr:MAG: hybrid sensor histidine kinase/response regulator [Acidobacteriota bacterium]
MILAVNDNFDSLNLLSVKLSDDSLSILTAENGEIALEMIRETKPDLIISDVVMPGMNGIELCRCLKTDPATRDIPILLLTALRYDEAAIVEGLKAGAADYLQAQAPIELLRNKVEYLIAEHKRTEAARLESEKHFRSLIENSLDIITILNADGTIRYESPSVERVLGYEPSELVGKSAFELVHPDDIWRVFEIFDNGVQKENYAGCVEFRYRHKDGSWRVLEAMGKNLLSEPRVAGIIVNSRDITERKRMELLLRENEKRYQLAMDAAKDYAILMLDRDGYVVSWNSGGEAIKGYKADEIIGHHVSCFYPAEELNQERPEQELQAAMTEGSFQYEGWRLRRDGSRFWADGVLTALRDEQGQLQGFLKVTRDITERRQREESLRQSEQLLRAILDNSPALIYIKDLDGRYIVVNQQFENMSQLTKDEIIGKTAYDTFSAEIADVVRAHEQQVLESGKPLEVEETAIVGDQLRHYITMTFPLNDSASKPYALCGISTDITAHKSLEDQLRHSQKMEAVGLLAGGIAHDFNNLLTAIIGYSQLLLRSFDNSDPRSIQIEEIERAGNRASALTRQLLAFSRKQILQPQVLDLNSLTENLSKLLRRLIGEDIELVTVLDPQLAKEKADPGLIEQVIMNLAVNGRDAMHLGGRLTIETGNVNLDSESLDTDGPNGDYVMVAVTDTGCGIDTETKARIFDPFFTTKETGKGTGLGLSTVYGILKQSGGHIRVDSEPGSGSTFKVYLPRANGQAEAEAININVKQVSFGDETILLVEDDPAVRILARIVLETNGYIVLAAAGPKEALRKAQDHSQAIHLLVTDVVMPEMDGRALANSIGLIRPDIRVLYMSGYTDDAMTQRGVLDPGIAFLQKPFAPDGFLQKVREVLGVTNALRH